MYRCPKLTSDKISECKQSPNKKPGSAVLGFCCLQILPGLSIRFLVRVLSCRLRQPKTQTSSASHLLTSTNLCETAVDGVVEVHLQGLLAETIGSEAYKAPSFGFLGHLEWILFSFGYHGSFRRQAYLGQLTRPSSKTCNSLLKRLPRQRVSIVSIYPWSGTTRVEEYTQLTANAETMPSPRSCVPPYNIL